MKTSAALAIAAVGVLIGGYGWMRGSSAPSRPATGSAAVAGANDKQVVVHEHRYVSALPGASAAQGARGREQAEAEAETVQAAARRPFDPEEHRFQIESSFDEDPPPTVASRQLEKTILKNFSMPAGKGATVESLECKATRCRLEVTFENKQKDSEVIRDVFMRSDDLDVSGTVVERTVDKDGRIHAVMYLGPSKSAP